MDIAVALIFFNRPETLKKVFDKVAEAKPSKLFLIQDGPRNEADLVKIQECRRVVDKVDWECEVFKSYSEINMGCGQRPATGITWVFEHVDKAIILEDDCVPASTFFSYCYEMLERYENDKRVGIVSGLNHFKTFDFGGDSYGFSRAAGIWGWATWRDRWEKYDYTLSKYDNQYIVETLSQDIRPKRVAMARIKEWGRAREQLIKNEKISFWDHQWSFIRNINSWVSIVPKYNQITNIGAGSDSTHAKASLKSMPKKIAGFFFMDTYDLEFPLKHTDYLIVNRKYDNQYFNITYPNLLLRLIYKIKRIAVLRIINKLQK